MRSQFITGLSTLAEAAERRQAGAGIDFNEISLLPDAEKQRLCRSLLAEFGVTKVRVTNGGEMIHSCCLNLGGHRHGDTNPSASLNYQKLTFKCRGCGHGGGLLWFIATARGTDTAEARGWLVTETGVGGEQSLSSLLAYFDAVCNPERSQRALLPRMDPRVLDPWLLIHPWMTEDRDVPEWVCTKFKVGYNPQVRCRVGEGFVASERIVLPHFWKGDLVGWQTRRLDATDGTDKYISSPDFPTDSTVYHYDARRPAVVVESILSVLAKYDCCPILESTFGASVTDRQIRLLAMHPRVILFYDNDPPGWAATTKVGEALLSQTDVFVVDNPWGADAADLDRDTFSRLVAAPVPYILWRKPEEVRKWVAPLSSA